MNMITRIKLSVLAITGLMLSTSVIANKKDVISREEGRITFRVDPDLTEPTGEGVDVLPGSEVIDNILSKSRIQESDQRVIASSFADDQLGYYGQSPFFKGMIEAFADHRPVVLSPDVVWLLICQGFAHHVNYNPEQLRDLFVDHEGKIDLVVESKKNVLIETAHWDSIVNGFAQQIKENTKGEIADVITTEFSTTGVNEHMASQIVLMETVKAYFEYIVMYGVCGIPSVTLTGTPEDWQSVLERTRKLETYGLGWWVSELEPILKEFVNASKGKPDSEFWRSIVKKYRPGEMRGPGCGMDLGSTDFDGWFLKFLPYDEKGRTPEKVKINHSMQPEMVRTDFKYIVFNDFTGELESVTQMEFWAGIVGMDIDPVTYTMTPKIGWFVRVNKSNEELLAEFKDKDLRGELELKINKVPEIIKSMDHINMLRLVFTGRVYMPQWMDEKNIDHLTIEGVMTPQEEESIKARFPKANVRNLSPKK